MNPSQSSGTVLLFAGTPDVEPTIARPLRALGVVVATTTTEAEWRMALVELRPVVALVLVDADDGSGIARVRTTRSAAPNVPVVAISRAPNVSALTELLRLGAADFVDQAEGSGAIAEAIQRVGSSGTSPKVEAYSPKVEAYSPKVEAYSPKVDAYSPKVERYTPEVTRPNADFRVSPSTPAPSRPPISGDSARSFPPARPTGASPHATSALDALAGRKGAGILAKATLSKDGSGQTVSTPATKAVASSGTPDDLPVMDAKLGELQEMMAQPDCPVEDVERFVVRDPALVVAVLKLANSAYFRSPRMVTNIREACVRLGNRQVFALLLESLLRRTFSATSPAARTVFEGMWKNASLTARVARKLSEWQRLGRPEDAYVAALLHNLGEFVLVWRVVGENPPDLHYRLADEADRISAEHETVGTLAAQKWGLPPQVQGLAGNHHRGRKHEPPQDAALRVSIVACWALARSVAGDYLPNMPAADPLALFDELGLPEQLRQRVAEECLAALEGL